MKLLDFVIIGILFVWLMAAVRIIWKYRKKDGCHCCDGSGHCEKCSFSKSR